MPRLLILDDEKLIRWSLNHIFIEEGYEVDPAATVEEAARLANSRSYALILADLEVCGDQAMACLSELVRVQKGAKIIVLTAVPGDQAELRLGGFRADRILEKPFDSEEIRAAVKAVLAAAPVKEKA
ncbi:MAG: response regulator [Candidatus Aminicenantales bacterium]|jgi:DNA-binding response OmpR family regulator